MSGDQSSSAEISGDQSSSCRDQRRSVELKRRSVELTFAQVATLSEVSAEARKAPRLRDLGRQPRALLVPLVALLRVLFGRRAELRLEDARL